MALLKASDIRAMSPEVRTEKLIELRDDLMHERGIGAMGGAPASPGKIRALRKNIARILTIQKEATLSSGNRKKETASSSSRKKEAGPPSRSKTKEEAPPSRKKSKEVGD